jgi:hypothetical protein
MKSRNDNMQDKAEKKGQKEIKVRDLKPAKDAKGGQAPPDPDLPAVQKPRGSN